MSLKKHIHHIIFKSDTLSGKIFDLALIVTILFSILLVMLDSIEKYHRLYGVLFYKIEWGITFLFTVEYLLRLWSCKNRLRYMFSFFGVIDLLAVLPSYLSILFPSVHYFLIIRILRVLRIFRILKLVKFIGEENFLLQALEGNRRKILVFLFSILTMVVIMGSLMYLVESESNAGFTSIPISVYWAIVTLTTVGYGDISPKTPLGQIIASLIMITGYSIIAIPTGVFVSRKKRSIK